MKKGSRVYFIAIAGTGMSALAGLMKEMGCEIAGSDLACYSPVKELLEDLQVSVNIGYDLDHIRDFKPDYVVIGNFVRRDNPQAQWVIENSIPYGSLPSTLEDQVLVERSCYVVTGTHGKSTTSTCLAHLMSSAGLDPSFFIGAVSLNFQKSFHLGAGEAFVLEGDEYDTAFFDKESKFLHYRPKTVIWTSLEFDHADIFPNMERLELMFRKLLRIIPEDGHLIYCKDYPRISEILSEEAPFKYQTESYGFSPDSDHVIEKYSDSERGMSFQLGSENFSSSMGGRFNALNFVAAILAAKHAGIQSSQISKGLQDFKGLKRRQELRFEKNAQRIIDDFAHHPTAVKEVIDGIKSKYPGSRLVVFFEPRSNTTRRNFFQQAFVEAFSKADVVLLPEVFKKESLAEGEALEISQLVQDLISQEVDARGPLTTDQLLEASSELLDGSSNSFLILSNGAFDGLHQKLISLIQGD